jgi:dGTPase
VIRTLLDREVENVIATSAAAIRESGVGTADDVRRHPHPLIQYSGAFVRKNREMRKFLYANLYYHPEVAGANRRACDLLGDVFSAYKKNPALLGRRATARIRREGLERTLCDYLSGMTDLYLIEEHRKLFPSRHARRRVRRVHPG